MQPMNYIINTGNTGDAFMQGADRTLGFMNAVTQQKLAQQKEEAARIANEQAIIRQQRFQEVALNPTAGAVQKLMIEFPELSEQFKRSYDSLSGNEKEDAIATSYSVVSALKQGKQDVAVSELDRKIEAAENAGDQGRLQKYQMLRDSVVASPEGALFGLQGLLFAGMGGDKYAEAVSKLDKNDREEKELPYKLEQERVKAKYAEPEALLDIEKKGWDITKIKEDIGYQKQMARIAAMNASTSRADSDLKRQELQLKVQEAQSKLNGEIRAKVADAESARSSIDNFINTADRLMKNPMLPRVLGPIEGRMSSAPLSDEAADAIALIDTLSSQAFLSQIPAMKGSGALSDAEGKKLQAALTNLSRVQSEKQFEANLKEAQRILLKSRANLAQKYGIPDTVPDTPAAAPSGRTIEDLLKKYGQ